MTFEAMTHYVETNLATDAAAYLDARVGNFRNYFGLNNYFNEDTVKALLSRLLTDWIIANDPNETAMVFTELPYPGFGNYSDVAVVYRTADGVPIPDKRLFIELKTDFDPESVNDDTNLLDLIAGVGMSPLTKGYAMYTVFTTNPGWTGQIDAPTQPKIGQIPILVAP